MSERVSTVSELEALPEGTIIVLADVASAYDIHVKDTASGWEQDPGEWLVWRSIGDDGVPRSSQRLGEYATKYGYLVIGEVIPDSSYIH